MTKKEYILSLIKENEEAFSITHINDSYIYPEIPNKKLRNAKEVYELGIKDEILWLGDRTLFGSAKENVIITEYGLFTYSKIFGDLMGQYVFWDELLYVEYSPENDALYFVMSENDEDKNVLMSLNDIGLTEDNEIYIDTFVEVFNKIAQNILNEKKVLIENINNEFEKEDFEAVIELTNTFINTYKSEIDVNYFDARINRVVAFFRLDNYENALRDIESTINEWEKIYDKFSFLYDLKGDILLEYMGYYPALQAYKVAFESETDNENNKNEIIAKFNEIYERMVSVFEEANYNDRKLILIEDDFYDISAKQFKILKKDKLPNIIFPVGHPVAKELYIGHPFNSQIYIPFASYEETIFMDRFQEFSYFLQCLGATKIHIENKRGKEIEMFENKLLEFGVGGGTEKKIIENKIKIGGSVNLSKDENNQLQSNSERRIARTQIFSPTQKPFLPDNLVWYPNESSWQRLYEQRINGGILKHKEIISTKQSQFISETEKQNLQVEFNYYVTNVNVSYDKHTKNMFNEKKTTEWLIDVEFAPIDELTDNVSETKNQNEYQLDFSENEEKYIDEIKFMLEDDGEIDENERRMLKRKSQKYGISEEKALELEKSLMSSNVLTTEELEYIEELKECAIDGDISDGDRRILKRLAYKLGISEERAKELENLAFKTEKEQVYTADEKKYIEEIKFCLEDDGEISTSERRMLNKERDNLGIAPERAEYIEQKFIKEIKK